MCIHVSTWDDESHYIGAMSRFGHHLPSGSWALPFLHCAFSYVSSNYLHLMMQTHIAMKKWNIWYTSQFAKWHSYNSHLLPQPNPVPEYKWELCFKTHFYLAPFKTSHDPKDWGAPELPKHNSNYKTNIFWGGVPTIFNQVLEHKWKLGF